MNEFRLASYILHGFRAIDLPLGIRNKSITPITLYVIN